MRGIVVAGAVLVVALALALRVLALGREPASSDEAVVGLMAGQILHGHFFAFYWGQRYGGVEPYVTAALFGLFGQSALTLGLTPVLLDVVSALLIWRIGKRLFPGPVGIGAAVLFLAWPEVYIWQSTLEYGFRWAALVCGLGALLLVLRLEASEHRAREAGAPRGVAPVQRVIEAGLLGAAVGLGWWATPEVGYYLLPAGGLVIVDLARRKIHVGPGQLAAFAGATVVSALPWLYDNIGHGFPSLHAGPQVAPSFAYHLKVLITHVAPMILGLRLPVSGSWVGGEDLGLGLYAAALICGAAFIVACAWKRKALVLVAFAVLAPLLYAYSPFTWYWQDGRYGVYLAPVVCLLAVAGAYELGQRVPLARLPDELRARVRDLAGPIAVVAMGLGLSLYAVSQSLPFVPVSAPSVGRTGWLSWHANPDAWLAPAQRALAKAGVSHVYAGYWIAYALSFESRAAITASGPIFARYPPYLAEIEKASRSAWVLPNPARLSDAELEVGTSLLEPGCIDGYRTRSVPLAGTSGCLELGELEGYLRARKDPFEALDAGDLLVVIPSRPVAPSRVLAAAGIKH